MDPSKPSAPQSTQPTSAPEPIQRQGRGGEAERWFALVLRTVHLAAVVGLGAALLGAPVSRGASGLVVVGSGVLLLAQDLHARRLAIGEFAGVVVLVKLLAVGWAAWADQHALVVFWGVLAVSSLSSHAPKRWRHWSVRRG